MASPIFFQETHLLTDEARNQIKPLIKTYKEVRDEMYKGFVYPIGEEPTNSSWSGFQNTIPDAESGYITLFRERLNQENISSIQLKFMKNRKIELEDLMTGETKTTQVDEDGWSAFTIDQAGDYRFYKYTIID